jgi:hypothetical protein
MQLARVVLPVSRCLRPKLSAHEFKSPLARKPWGFCFAQNFMLRRQNYTVLKQLCQVQIQKRLTLNRHKPYKFRQQKSPHNCNIMWAFVHLCAISAL